MFRDCYMVTVDLKDACYLVSVAGSARRYLRFKFEGALDEFTCLPFGLSTAPYVFTKILKPVASRLREMGLVVVIYLDDILLIADSQQGCTKQLARLINLLEGLGFLVNYEKSALIPAKRQRFLGYILDSGKMTIELPKDKRDNALALINRMSRKETCRINEWESFVGTLGSCCPAIKYVWAYTKVFEEEKTRALLDNPGNCKARLSLTREIKEDLAWWKTSIVTSVNPIDKSNYVMEIFSDASLPGWAIREPMGSGRRRIKSLELIIRSQWRHTSD